ncbi:MAG: alpha/beta hydrolase fold domain-containing protein [Dehalococcoidia bacterium]
MGNVVVEQDVVIGKGGDRELKVDVFRPADQSGLVPGVLFMPGGGWRNCDRAALAERYGYPLAKHGLVCVNGEYRVMDEAPWPAQIHDVKAAIRWVRANSASLGIAPSQIVIAGKSAGGQLALLAAGTPNVPEFEGNGGNSGVSTEVAGAVGSSPVSDLADFSERRDLEALLGPNPSADFLKAISPITYANRSYPPTLIFHGTSDTRVHHHETMRFFEKLEQAEVPVDLHLYAGQDHFFDREPHFYQAVCDAIELFISRYVPLREPVASA